MGVPYQLDHAMKLQDRARNTSAKLLFNHLIKFTRYLPRSRKIQRLLSIERNVPYLRTGDQAHLLDVIKPKKAGQQLPVVFYVHGGGFTLCSKDTHHGLASIYAARGYLVFNINYRLAPKHPYPAAHADTAAAYAWVAANCERYGGDPEKIIVAGESAGGNLAASIMAATLFESKEPWARELWAINHVPAAVQIICGFVQVSNPNHYREQYAAKPVVTDTAYKVASDLARAYLGERGLKQIEPAILADPLSYLVKSKLPNRPRKPPAVFLPCGTADILIKDNKRLEHELMRLNIPVTAKYYPQQPHAFHAIPWNKEEAQHYWTDCLRFLADNKLAPPPPEA